MIETVLLQYVSGCILGEICNVRHIYRIYGKNMRIMHIIVQRIPRPLWLTILLEKCLKQKKKN